MGKGERKQKECLLIPGGSIFGVQITGCGVTVKKTSSEASGILVDDRILSVNGKSVHDAATVRELVNRSHGNLVRLEIERGGKTYLVEVRPTSSEDGYRLGVTLSDGAAGIGTVTFIDPETGAFGGLGHGICDADSGEVLPMCKGVVTGVILGGVMRGQAGKPGELRGVLTEEQYGILTGNTACGVFGILERTKPLGGDATPVPIADRGAVHTGEAEIISTVKNGMTARYRIEITEIDVDSHSSKSFRIRVKDPALSALTGGIVRGMSGSPILQDGRLVGAVTHVLIGDPGEGYGIFIENMLESMTDSMKNAA